MIFFLYMRKYKEFFNISARKFRFQKYKEFFRVSIWGFPFLKFYNIRGKKFHFSKDKEFFGGIEFLKFFWSLRLRMRQRAT